MDTAVTDNTWLGVTAVGVWAMPFVTAIGFWLVRRQILDAKRSLETQTREQVYQGSMEVLRMFLEYPDLRPYFYDSKIIETSPSDHGQRVLAACEIMADHWENIAMSGGTLDNETSLVWTKYMKNIYETSPSLQTFFVEEGYRYSVAFLRTLKSDLPETCRQPRRKISSAESAAC